MLTACWEGAVVIGQESGAGDTSQLGKILELGDSLAQYCIGMAFAMLLERGRII